jgi:hypothetical protein
MVAVVAIEREELQARAFLVRVSPCGHVEVTATGVLVAEADVEAQAADVEARIVVAMSAYRYVSEIDGGRRARLRQLRLDGTVGPVLWRYTPQPAEEARCWRARVRDPGALREQLQVELTMVAAGCPLMLDRIDVDLVAVDRPRYRLRA